MNFTDFDIPQSILSALKDMGFEKMTPIQEVTYPIIAEGKDLCALAETGSGKTAACAVPLVQKIDVSVNEIQGLVIVPTRELCMQYVDEIQKVAARTEAVPFAVYGGFDKEIQRAKLKHGVHILVATPGRLIDLIYEGRINLSNIKCFILDEADELLKEGFLEDIEFIISCIIHEHQTLLFAATMADDIKRLVNEALKNPVHISLIKKRAIPKSLDHYFINVHPKDKEKELIHYLKEEEIKQVIIFCNTRHLVDTLFRSIRKTFRDIEFIHAGLPQGKRTSIINQFRNQKIKILLASDVAGRGLDFSNVSHIINWDFPKGEEQYTHRTGRAGRMGKKGKAFTFVRYSDAQALRKLVRRKSIEPIWIGKNLLEEKIISYNIKSKHRKKGGQYNKRPGKSRGNRFAGLKRKAD